MRGARTGSGRPARDAIGSDAAAGVGRAAGFAGSRATRGYLRGEAGGPDDELALEELVLLTGVDLDTVRDLERFGLISPHMVAGAPFYSQEAGTIARLAHAFARHGVEARHLRAYKGAAEREAGMVQQVIMPLLRQRNPEARLAAAETAEELARLGGELRSALLRAALDELR